MQHLIGEEKERTLVRAVLSLFLLVTKRLYGKEWEWSIGQIKTCRKKQHVEIDDIKEMSDLICSKAAVGGNYNSTRDNQTEEGCLSLKGVRPCTRYQKIEVDYLDQNFKKQHGKYLGWTAQIIQHEIDHCNGIVI